MMDKAFRVFLGSLTVGFLVVLVWLAAGLTLETIDGHRCRTLGFREAAVTWTYRRYCVLLLEGTAYLVPLHRAEAVAERDKVRP